ncbi:MAG TPA: hypothetical protein DDZ81_05505 [Acetobacteraceae bacterium]|jgi:hypothetical protein|nr:hypothetical protein [Acetobacteraceae bacterium]
MVSASGTVVRANPGGVIADASGNLWGIAGGRVYVNSVPDQTTSGVIELAYVDGLIWQENSSLLWWSKASPSDPWSPSEGTLVAPPLPVSNNLIAGVDARGNSSVVQDARGVSWNVIGGQVAAEGVVDPTTRNVRELAIVQGQVWQENTSGLWWTKAVPSDAWTSPDGPGGTSVNPLNGASFEIVGPPDYGGIADPVQVGRIIAVNGGAASITTPLLVNSISVESIFLTDSALHLSEIAAGSGPLVVNGASDLAAGSSISFGLLGTGSLPPGVLENNGTMTVSASTLTFGAVIGSGVISVTGDGSVFDVGDFATTETIQLHSANLVIRRPLLHKILHASIVFDAKSSVMLGSPAASDEMFVRTGATSEELFLYGDGTMYADLMVSGVPELHASASAIGTVLLTPSITGKSLSTAGYGLDDMTTRTNGYSTGDSYQGPCPGLQRQFIEITQDNLNISSSVPNSFIVAGSGMNSIDVSSAGGSNVLDGGTASSFMTGGSGQDVFFMDARFTSAPTFSTIVAFHSFDDAVVWGIEPSVYTMHAFDDQGAVGAKGLDLVFSAPGRPEVSFVLAGYSSADLNNGRLSVTYGHTADLPGLPGSAFVMVHGAG